MSEQFQRFSSVYQANVTNACDERSTDCVPGAITAYVEDNNEDGATQKSLMSGLSEQDIEYMRLFCLPRPWHTMDAKGNQIKIPEDYNEWPQAAKELSHKLQHALDTEINASYAELPLTVGDYTQWIRARELRHLADIPEDYGTWPKSAQEYVEWLRERYVKFVSEVSRDYVTWPLVSPKQLYEIPENYHAWPQQARDYVDVLRTEDLRYIADMPENYDEWPEDEKTHVEYLQAQGISFLFRLKGEYDLWPHFDSQGNMQLQHQPKANESLNWTNVFDTTHGFTPFHLVLMGFPF